MKREALALNEEITRKHARTEEYKALDKSIKQLDKTNYLMSYAGWLLHIDTKSGIVHKYKKRFEVGVANAYLNNKSCVVITSIGKMEIIINQGELSKGWVIPSFKSSKTSKYRMIELRVSGLRQKRVVFREHMLIALCIWRFEIMKNCVYYDSIWTVDHIDGDKLNNESGNLRIISRSDNTKVSKNKEYKPVEWLPNKNNFKDIKIKLKDIN